MPAAALKNDLLSELGDGVVARSGGRSWPLPLASTEIDVEIVGGLAIVRTVRRFRNAEDRAIEATMTFPVPGDSALTGLRASIDGRELVATAKASDAARESYEAAIDDGKTAILHEEKLRGVHMLSLGNLGAGKEAAVTVTYVAPLSFASAVPTVRIPTSVGEIFGRSPLLASDALTTGDVALTAKVRTNGHGDPQVLGTGLPGAELPLDGSIVIAVPAWTPAEAKGRAADGRPVGVSVDRLPAGDLPLDLSIVFDRSGSTGDPMVTDTGQTTAWIAMADGLRRSLGRELRDGDRVRLYDYANDVRLVGEASGPDAVRLLEGLRKPNGGTETGLALAKAIADHAGDILLLTDGRSYAMDVGTLASKGRRVTAVLVGANALDAHVGNLAALTGGQLLVSPGDFVEETAGAALRSLRLASGNAATVPSTELPDSLAVRRGGAEIRVAWGEAASAEQGADDVGRYAAALSMPGLTQEVAARVAVEHGLCTHLTSLVLVDEAGDRQQGIPATRKVPLMAAGASPFRSGGQPRSMSFMARSAAPRYGASGMMSASPARESLSADVATRGWSGGDAPAPSGSRTRGGGKGMMKSVIVTDAPTGGRAVPFDLAAEASRVDWDTLAADADALGIDAMAPALRLVLLRVAALPAVAALAAALGKDAKSVAVAMVALADPASRPAGRLARRILAGAPATALADARRAVGL